MDRKKCNGSFYEYSSIDEGSFSGDSVPVIRVDDQEKSSGLNPQKIRLSNDMDDDLSSKINRLMSKEQLSVSDHIELKGKYNLIIQTLLWGKVIQALLFNTSCSIIADIFEELEPNLSDHYKGSHSNFFVQKLYGHLDLDSNSYLCKTKYLRTLFKRLVDVSSNKVGTFALQKLMNTFQNDFEFSTLQICLNDLSEAEILKMAFVSL